MDGIYQISLDTGVTLDFVVQDIARLQDLHHKVILIGLSGAITNRSSKKAPFFSGLEIARALKLPIVSISDPTLNMDGDLGLSWYAGNQRDPQFPAAIASILDGVSRIHNSELLMFGGSGGGYAALLLSTLLSCTATTLVWNPQTDISDYVAESVVHYIRVGFPSLAAKALGILSAPPGARAQQLRALLRDAGIRNDLRARQIGEKIHLLYLQNRSDWHVRRHALPYLLTHSWRRAGEAIFVEASKAQIAAYFGDWGDGHAVPPKAMLQEVLARLARGDTVSTVAQSLDTGLNGLITPAEHFSWPSDSPPVAIETATSRTSNAKVDSAVVRDA